jgi:hypothetical protein
MSYDLSDPFFVPRILATVQYAQAYLVTHGAEAEAAMNEILVLCGPGVPSVELRYAFLKLRTNLSLLNSKMCALMSAIRDDPHYVRYSDFHDNVSRPSRSPVCNGYDRVLFSESPESLPNYQRAPVLMVNRYVAVLTRIRSFSEDLGRSGKVDINQLWLDDRGLFSEFSGGPHPPTHRLYLHRPLDDYENLKSSHMGLVNFASRHMDEERASLRGCVRHHETESSSVESAGSLSSNGMRRSPVLPVGESVGK